MNLKTPEVGGIGRHDTSALEAEIDVLVYKLYGLTYAEVLVVDAGFGMGEGEYAAVEV